MSVLLAATVAGPLLGAWAFGVGYVLCLVVVLAGCFMEPGPLLEERPERLPRRRRPRSVDSSPRAASRLDEAKVRQWARRRKVPAEVVRDLLAAPRGELFVRAHGLTHRFEQEAGRLLRLAVKLDLVARLPRSGGLGFRVRLQDSRGRELEATSDRYRDQAGRYLFACGITRGVGDLFARRGLSYQVPVDGHVRLPAAGGRIQAELSLEVPGGDVFLARVEGRLPRGPEALDDGVTVVAALGSRSEGGVECPVCGGGLGTGEPERSCPRCETPHHRECWRFNGGCSTFGCRGGSG